MRISDWSSDVCSSDLAIGAQRRRDRDGVVARALSPPDVGDGVQARPCRFQDDPRLRAGRAIARTPPPAARAYRRRYSCGRAGRMEQLEAPRSEEHTSELQSLMRISYAVFCLKKKKITNNSYEDNH